MRRLLAGALVALAAVGLLGLAGPAQAAVRAGYESASVTYNDGGLTTSATSFETFQVRYDGGHGTTDMIFEWLCGSGSTPSVAGQTVATVNTTFTGPVCPSGLTILNVSLRIKGGTYYWIYDVDSTSTVDGTLPALGSSDTTAPTVPANLAATGNGADVDVSWTASTDDVGVTGYELRIDASATPVAVTAPPYKHLSASGADHTYEVRALDAAGNASAWSPLVSYLAPVAADTTAPSTPTDLAAAVSGGDVSVSWSPSTDDVGVTGYELRLDAGVPFAVASPYVHTGGAAEQHTYEVRALDAAGNASPWASVTYTPATVAGTTSTTYPATGGQAAAWACRDVKDTAGAVIGQDCDVTLWVADPAPPAVYPLPAAQADDVDRLAGYVPAGVAVAAFLLSAGLALAVRR